MPHIAIQLKEETLGGNSFLAIESTPGDEEEEGAVRKGMITPVPHPRTERIEYAH